MENIEDIIKIILGFIGFVVIFLIMVKGVKYLL